MKSFKKPNGQLILANVRLSYANLFEPKAINDGDPKYSVALIIDKNDTDTVSLIEKEIEAQKAIGKASKWGGKMPAKLKTPLRDGDEDRPEDEAYQGRVFINANSEAKPQVVTQFKTPATEEDVYSGCYALVSVRFYPFDSNGNRGIACRLGNVMKLRDGTKLSGGTSAEEDFEGIELDDLEDLGDLL